MEPSAEQGHQDMSVTGGSGSSQDQAAPSVPRQTDGRHDAFDIYAEIYALRLETLDNRA